jgi:hypothetical protein
VGNMDGFEDIVGTVEGFTVGEDEGLLDPEGLIVRVGEIEGGSEIVGDDDGATEGSEDGEILVNLFGDNVEECLFLLNGAISESDVTIFSKLTLYKIQSNFILFVPFLFENS